MSTIYFQIFPNVLTLQYPLVTSTQIVQSWHQATHVNVRMVSKEMDSSVKVTKMLMRNV